MTIVWQSLIWFMKLVMLWILTNFSIGLFVDLSKASDTLNHRILLQKLNHYEIRGVTLKWFESYLSNRYQYVEYNGVKSNLLFCGVPQGSILGPVFFLNLYK